MVLTAKEQKEEIEKLAASLKARGLAFSMTDAMETATSIIRGTSSSVSSTKHNDSFDVEPSLEDSSSSLDKIEREVEETKGALDSAEQELNNPSITDVTVQDILDGKSFVDDVPKKEKSIKKSHEDSGQMTLSEMSVNSSGTKVIPVSSTEELIKEVSSVDFDETQGSDTFNKIDISSKIDPVINESIAVEKEISKFEIGELEKEAGVIDYKDVEVEIENGLLDEVKSLEESNPLPIDVDIESTSATLLPEELESDINSSVAENVNSVSVEDLDSDKDKGIVLDKASDDYDIGMENKTLQELYEAHETQGEEKQDKSIDDNYKEVNSKDDLNIINEDSSVDTSVESSKGSIDSKEGDDFDNFVNEDVEEEHYDVDIVSEKETVKKVNSNDTSFDEKKEEKSVISKIFGFAKH